VRGDEERSAVEVREAAAERTREGAAGEASEPAVWRTREGAAGEARGDAGRGGEARDAEHRARRRAREGLRDAPERAGARAHFRAMGIDPARLGGPIVGIASTWTGTMPCNLNQRELSDRAAEAIRAAGGVALPFNTIAVSDNQSQGTPGMRASLISREVIADSIELMVHAHDFDAVVCLVGCDKTVPAALMALARVDKPAVILYSGPM
jgi:dihydroxyacid dehydratase/phosphogluconate dehydratase